jgi:5-methyltetrahydrofolate--homocysteine methyltransferase
MSALLTTTVSEMGSVVKKIQESDLRSRVRIIIGGATVSPEIGKQIGADAAPKDAVEGVNLCRMWVSKKMFCV